MENIVMTDRHKVNRANNTINLLELFFALKKRIFILVAALIAGGLIAGAYTKLFVTRLYCSTTTMLVLTSETTLSSLADLQIGSQLTKDYSRLILTRSVLEEVIDNLELDMSYRTLRSNIAINNPEDTRLLELTVTDSSPERVKTIADELAAVSADFISDQMEVPAPKIVEESEVPTEQTSPSLSKNIMLGALLGLVAAAGSLTVMVMMDDTLKSEDDIVQYLGIPVLASLPDRKDYIGGKPSDKKKSRKGRRRKHR